MVLMKHLKQSLMPEEFSFKKHLMRHINFLKIEYFLNSIGQKIPKPNPYGKPLLFAESSDNSKFMDKIEALSSKMDSQYKDIKGEMKEMRDGCNNCGGNHTSSECDDQPMNGPNEGEANYVQGGYRGGGFRGNYYIRSSGNWQDRQQRDNNRDFQPRTDNPNPTNSDKKEESDFEKMM